jgi:energy-converting hydrogenase Eha subunit E
MTDKLVPALIGGLILGVLSSIPFVNYCCCIWAIGGGVVAVMMYVKKSPTPVSIGEGAMLGAMAGVIGGVIYFVLGTIVALIVGTAAVEAAMKQAGMEMPLSGVALILLSTFMGALFLVALGAIGGLIGIPIFEKRKGGDAPPPPPTFGEQPGGGGYAGGSGGFGASS